MDPMFLFHSHLPTLDFILCNNYAIPFIIEMEKEQVNSDQQLGPYLLHTKIQKLFKILRHIESYGTCMGH